MRARTANCCSAKVFTVYDRANGWAWGQAANDLYVGYVREERAGRAISQRKPRSRALMAPLFPAPDLKTPVRDLLPMNAAVPVLDAQGRLCADRRRPLSAPAASGPRREKDFVAVAERFLGVPYVWGGKTAAGLDCSGLIQTALQAAGKAAPRDTDMMEKALGRCCRRCHSQGAATWCSGKVIWA